MRDGLRTDPGTAAWKLARSAFNSNRLLAPRKMQREADKQRDRTCLRIKQYGDIVMLDRVLGHVQAEELRCRIAVVLGQCELGVDNPDTELTGPIKHFQNVRALEHKVHTLTVAEVREESQQLDDFLLLNHLDSDLSRFPLFVNRNDHSASGYRKRRRKSAGCRSVLLHRPLQNTTPEELTRQTAL